MGDTEAMMASFHHTTANPSHCCCVAQMYSGDHSQPAFSAMLIVLIACECSIGTYWLCICRSVSTPEYLNRFWSGLLWYGWLSMAWTVILNLNQDYTSDSLLIQIKRICIEIVNNFPYHGRGSMWIWIGNGLHTQVWTGPLFGSFLLFFYGFALCHLDI